MYYLNSRFYDASIGRFINADGLLGQEANILSHNMYSYTSNNPIMRIDQSGDAWWHWAIGATVLAAAVILTVATAGAAAGTIAFAVHGIATGALIGGAIGGTLGAVSGGMSYSDEGELSWDWDNASKGFMMGSITGTISGAAGSGLGNIGKASKYYWLIQGGINAGTAGAVSTVSGLLTNSFSWISVGTSMAFGFAGGTIGITSWGEGIRSVVVGAGLGLTEGGLSEILEWQSQKIGASTYTFDLLLGGN